MDTDAPRSQVYPEIASAPEPTLTIDGHAAVIAGVRFIWTDHCAYCREQFRMFTDGGVIKAGIRAGEGSAEWYETWHPAGPLQPPPSCPNPACGHPAPFAANPQTHVVPSALDTRIYRYGDPSPVYQAHRLVSRVWDTIRAKHPDLAAQADEYARGTREADVPRSRRTAGRRARP